MYWRLIRNTSAGLAAALLCGCSYQVLTFFFTGVPDPNQQPTAIEELVADEADYDDPRAIPVQQSYQHGPWAARQCSLCHQTQKVFSAGGEPVIQPSLVTDKGQLCVDCHGVPGQPANIGDVWVHGPVANGLCTSCHYPHYSPYASLLTTDQPHRLCGACHESSSAATDTHYSSEAQSNCLTCHNPHAGMTPFMLKQGVET